MATRSFRGEDFAGLTLAVALHGGLLALLVFQPVPVKRAPEPERITVTLSEEAALTSSAPEPQAQAAPPAAPQLAPEPEPEPLPQAAPPKALPRPRPAPVVAPAPRPVARPVPQPRIAPSPAARTAPRAQPAPTQRTAPRPASASRISDDFLKGVPGARASTAARTSPAATTIGPAVQSALAGAISRELKPHWAAPQGAEADRLVTILAWSLNRDGTLAGTPRLVRQDGISDANRAQAARHAEQAIRAVQLAAPFNLPAEYYTAWQRVASFRFDRRLSQ